MRAYTCDGCKLPVEPPIYTLMTLYSADGHQPREQHFHWDCLKAYVKEARGHEVPRKGVNGDG